MYDIRELPRSVVVIGEVLEENAQEDQNPLLYFNRDYADLCLPIKP